jgi:hypothetical protein
MSTPVAGIRRGWHTHLVVLGKDAPSDRQSSWSVGASPEYPFSWVSAWFAVSTDGRLARRAWRHSVWRSAGTFRTGIDQARTMAASSILGPARVSVGICWVLRSRGPLVHRDRTDRLIAWFNWIASLLGSQPVGAC